MHFDVLGPLRAYGAAGRVVVPSGRTSAALCWLVLNANDVVPAPALARVLWPDRPASAQSRARVLARSLEPLLDAGTLELEPSLRLVVSDDAVDARRFERLVTEARRHVDNARPDRAQANLREALDLWRGAPCPELADAVDARPIVARLVGVRLDAQEDLNALVMAEAVDYPLVAELRAQAILQPNRPRLQRQLALALYLTNRQVEGLDVLRQLRDRSGDPDGHAGHLQAAMLRHDPALLVHRSPGGPSQL